MSKEIEKEVRYLISDNIKNEIINHCEVLKKRYYTVDVVIGLNGFDSLDTYGYILRIRDKGNQVYIENKRRISNGDFEEQRMLVQDIKTPLNFFMNMGYEPYLVIERERVELKYKNLKIFIDEITLLGTFVEIEYQDSNEQELKKFLSKFQITGNEQDLYGNIFKERIKEEEFNNQFMCLVKKFIK